MPDVGYYTLPVILSFEGIDRNVNKTLGSKLGTAGRQAGTKFAKSAGDAIARDKSIEKATEAKAKALDKVANAAGKVRAAEAALTSARSSGNQARVVAAEERLATARRRTTAETRALASATKDLDQAVKTGAQSAQATAASAGGGGDGGMMGLMLLGRGGLGGLTAMGGTAGTLAGTAAKAGIAGVLTVAAGAAIAAPFFAAFKAFDWGASVGLPLERVTNEFRGVTGATKGEMAAVGAQARALGSDINLAGTTASDAAKAMTELAKAGFTTQQAIDASRATVQLATAGQIDAAQAAEIVGTAINTFSLDATDAQMVVDDFAATVLASAADIPDLALALQMGGAAAQGFGISMQDTLATLGTFAQMGIKSSDAGTLMKTSLLAWQSASEPQATAMAELNLQLSDPDGNFVGYRNMLEQLAVASKNMTQEQFNAATSTVFGNDAFRAAMLAKGDAIPIFDRIREELDKEGQAARMAGAQMDGLPGIVEGVSNTMDGLKLSVYDAGSAIATALGKEGLSVFDSFSGWIKEHQPEMIGFFTTIGTSAVDMATVITQAVGGTADILAIFVNAVGDVHGAALRTGAALKRLTGDTEGADKWDAEADAAFGLADGLYGIKDRAFELEQQLPGLKDRIQNAGDAANTAAQFTRDLGGAIATVSGQDTIIKTPTPEQLAAIDQAKFKIEAIPGTKDVRVVPLTDEATTEMNEWRRLQGEQPVTITPKLSPSGAQQFIGEIRNFVANNPVTPAFTPGIPSLLDPNRPPLGGGRAGGGSISGPGGPKSDIIPIWASTGEHMLSAKDVAAMGGQDGVYAFRRKLHGYATGGAIDGPIDPRQLAMQFAQSVSGSGYGASAGPNLWDCSGFMSDIYAILTGKPYSGGERYFTTEGDFEALGFVRGFNPNSAFNIGVNSAAAGSGSPHMAGTLMGYNVESGGGTGGGPTIGSGASGASQFSEQYHLPIPASAYSSASSSSTGGYGAPDSQKIADAEENLRQQQADVAIQEQELRELKADAEVSQRMAAEEQLRKAKADEAKAQAELAEARRGEPLSSSDVSSSSVSSEGGAGDLSPIGQIFGSFLKETLGFDGSLFPDIANLMPVQMAGNLLSAFSGPLKGAMEGKLGIQQPGWSPGMPVPGSDTTGAPFGMPNVAAPPMPAPGQHPGSGAPPGPAGVTVDASQTFNGTVGLDPVQIQKQQRDAAWRGLMRIP